MMHRDCGRDDDDDDDDDTFEKHDGGSCGHYTHCIPGPDSTQWKPTNT
jgi:hypothetical protein